jgi:hypothetical protein
MSWLCRSLTGCAIVLAATAACGCAHGGSGVRSRPGNAEVRGFYYSDDDGLDVTTVAARVEQPVSPNVSFDARGLVDHIVLTPKPLNPGHAHDANQPTGHRDADVVTSASSTVAGGAVADKWRYEGLLGGRFDGTTGGLPFTVRALGRTSSETDYKSYSGVVRASIDLFQRNTTIAAFVGGGHDDVSPVESPPGQEAFWPATHDRWNFGVSISQLLLPTLVLSGGISTNQQNGTLSNPYRRALVKTTLFPEVVPATRGRYTAFVRLSWYVGAGTAVHLQQGAYADTWGVGSTIPEVTVAKAFGARWLFDARYRYYGQSAASFYQARYSRLEPLVSGDARLGVVHEHSVGADALFTFVGERNDFGSVSVYASYSFATLRYDLLIAERIRYDDIQSHIVGLGVLASY